MIKERWQYDFSNLNSKTKWNKKQKKWDQTLFGKKVLRSIICFIPCPSWYLLLKTMCSPDSFLSIQECAVCVLSCSVMCDSMDCSLLGSSVHEIFLAKYWSGLPFPPPGGLLYPGIKPESLASAVLAGGFFTSSTSWEACGLPRVLSLDRSASYQTLHRGALTCPGQTEVARGLLGGLWGRQRKED